MTAADKIIATPGFTGKTAGGIVWWRLSGGIDMAGLSSAWEAAGLPAERLPLPPSPRAALTRAVGELRERQRLVIALESGGYALTRVKEGQGPTDDPAFATDLRVWLDKVGRLNATAKTPDAEADAVRLHERYTWHLDHVIQADVSPWLCRLAHWCDAISLRDTGGFYFVPGFAMERWQQVVEAVRGCSQHTLSQITAMQADAEAVNAILDSLTQEATAHAEAMLSACTDETLGPRALQSRITSMLSMEGKLGRYEELLGERLDGLRGRLEEVRASLSVAHVTAETREVARG